MEENRIDFAKWLRVLMYIAIAGLANTLVGIPSFIPTVITSWISRILMAVMVFSMFKLATANDRYKDSGSKAAVPKYNIGEGADSSSSKQRFLFSKRSFSST